MPMTKIRRNWRSTRTGCAGKADKIGPTCRENHWQSFAKQSEIETEISETEKTGKRERLEHKLATVKALIEKARWLATQV
jgi:hypothetical protein